MSAVKLIKKEFKNNEYLYKVISNQGTLRIPLMCLCEYGGLTALFKMKA